MNWIDFLCFQIRFSSSGFFERFNAWKSVNKNLKTLLAVGGWVRNFDFFLKNCFNTNVCRFRTWEWKILPVQFFFLFNEKKNDVVFRFQLLLNQKKRWKNSPNQRSNIFENINSMVSIWISNIRVSIGVTVPKKIKNVLQNYAK